MKKHFLFFAIGLFCCSSAQANFRCKTETRSVTFNVESFSMKKAVQRAEKACVKYAPENGDDCRRNLVCRDGNVEWRLSSRCDGPGIKKIGRLCFEKGTDEWTSRPPLIRCELYSPGNEKTYNGEDENFTSAKWKARDACEEDVFDLNRSCDPDWIICR